MIRFAIELSSSHEGRDRIQFHECAAEDLAIQEATATVVLAINSLHHSQDTEAGLAEVMRVLKPGGRLLVSDEEPEDGQFGHGDGPLSDPAAVVRTVNNCGFVDVNVSRHAERAVKMLLVTARKQTA